MKVLIISDNEEFLQKTSNFFIENGYDIIQYKWLLKAIDNIEEIKPQIILVNAEEFPRHWKTLCSFVKSGIGGNEVKVYLFEQNELSENKMQETSALGISGIIKKFSEFNNFFKKIENINLQTNELEKTLQIQHQIILTNPNDFSFMFGNILVQNENEIECHFEIICNLKVNDFIENCSITSLNSFKMNEEISQIEQFSAKVKKIDNEKSNVLLEVL